MNHFSVSVEELDLASAATPRGRRIQIRWKDRPLVDLTQGIFRCYLYPVYTPSGVPVTAESPVDHPHHNSIAVGADAFRVLLPPLSPALSTRREEATYNLYVNEVFQGRAPGRIWSTGVDCEEIDEGLLRIVQTAQWQGPEEWGADGGRRVLAEETRTIDIRPGDMSNAIDVRSQLRPTEWDIRIGPTRHAYFTVRLADGLRPVAGGVLMDSEGRLGQAAICGQVAGWVDMSGPASHGRQAGIAVIPHASTSGLPWIVADWGTITVNPFLSHEGVLNRGDTFDLGIRVLAHDGDAAESCVAEEFAAFGHDASRTGGLAHRSQGRT